MKRNHLKIFITLAAVAIPVFVLAMPHFAYADCWTYFGGIDISECTFAVTSWIAELAFQIAGAFLTITGVLLNGSMVATLNISQIVNATAAIGAAWRTIRDFSSIFIIFLLLYASIKMILGMKDSGLGNLIKNIVIAGLLINFSLFFTKFLVDTSNIVSLSFYNAIAPGQGVVAPTGAVQGLITTAFNDGGLSNVFMQSLDVQRFTGSAIGTAVGSTTVSDPNKNRTITMAYVGGTVLMVTAAFSFLFAAIAFAIRLGVLILLMAFSPIYFIGMIIPKTQEYSKKWLDTLLAMCIFMPVYLLLMYVAVSVINDPHFFDFANVTSISTGGTSSSVVNPQLVGIVLQYIIAFLFINAPMVAAIKIGSEGVDVVTKWASSATKWTQGQLTKGAKATGTAVWQGTAGRAASKLAENETLKDFASNWKVGGGLYQGIKATASGYDTELKKQVESKTKFGDSLGYDQKEMNAAQLEVRRWQQDLARAQAAGAPKPTIDAIEASLGTAKGKVSEVENKRKTNYANRVKTRSIDTIYTKVARKNKLAAAKMQIPIKEKELERKKKSLDETESDIKQLQRSIRNNGEIGTANTHGHIPAGTPTSAQDADMKELLKKQDEKTKKVNDVQEEIDTFKLIK